LTTNSLDQPGCSVKAVPSLPSIPSKPVIQPPRPKTLRQTSPGSSPAFGTPPRTPQLHTGLSFTLAETKLDAQGNNSDDSTPPYNSDDSLSSLDFGSPSRRRISSGTKRKRSESPTKKVRVRNASQRLQKLAPSPLPPARLNPSTETSIQHTPTKALMTSNPQSAERLPAAPAQLLSPASKIARSKLLAFSKLVTRKLPARPANAPPIVTEHTLDVIVKTRPTTQDELERIPGIASFLYACDSTDTRLLRNVIKFTAT
jgi:hypothetical protein